MEKLNKLIFDGEEYLPKKVLLKWIRDISDAVNSFSDRADPRAQGANKVISLLLEKIEPPQEHWKPSEEQMEAFKGYIEDFQARAEAAVGGWNNFDVMIRLYEQLKKL